MNAAPSIIDEKEITPEVKVNVNGFDVSDKEIDRVEVKSEEVQDILSQMPHWTIRWGFTYIFIMLTLVMCMSWFIKYPEVILAPITLTTEVPPSSLIARTSGNLTLLTGDDQTVQRGAILGFIQNTANTTQVLALMEELNGFRASFYKNGNTELNFDLQEYMQLGDLQDDYNSFFRNVEEFRLAEAQQGYQTQIAALNDQIAYYNVLTVQQEEHNKVMAQELSILGVKFRTDSVLFQSKVISKTEYDQRKVAYLQAERAYKNAIAGIMNNQIQVSQLKGRVGELNQQEQRDLKGYSIAIEGSMNILLRQLKAWEQQYLLKATLTGKVALFNYRSNDQYVQAGEEVLTVIPENNNYVGRAVVPIAGSGRLEKDQKVNIKFDNYPSREYGMVIGQVTNISLIPRQNNYYVEVKLSNGLLSSYGKQLIFKQEMQGQAEIITKDLRLLERFFYQIIEVLDNGA